MKINFWDGLDAFLEAWVAGGYIALSMVEDWQKNCQTAIDEWFDNLEREERLKEYRPDTYKRLN